MEAELGPAARLRSGAPPLDQLRAGLPRTGPTTAFNGRLDEVSTAPNTRVPERQRKHGWSCSSTASAPFYPSMGMYVVAVCGD